jgi:hypothetical protein
MLEEGFPIRPGNGSPTFHATVEVLVVAGVEEGVPKYKQGLMFSLGLRLCPAMAADWVEKARN